MQPFFREEQMFQTRTLFIVLRSPSSQEMDLSLDIFAFNIVNFFEGVQIVFARQGGMNEEL